MVVEILEVIRTRISSRAFDKRPVEAEKMTALIEAFRWGPSSYNKQPWRLIIAQSDAARAAWDAALDEGNSQWAPAAPLKLVVLGNPEEQPEVHGQDRWLLDCGLAVQNLLLQGTSMGLKSRCMVGWDEAKVKKGFKVPEGVRVACLIAMGYPGRVEDLLPAVQEKEKRPRVRKEATDIAYRDGFGVSFG